MGESVGELGQAQQLSQISITPTEPDADGNVPEVVESVEAGQRPDSDGASTSTTAPPGESPTPEGTDNSDLEVSQDQVENLLAVAGLDMNELSGEYEENGALSDASYDKLVTSGFPKALVDSYIQGQEALRENATRFIDDTAYGITGSKEGYQALSQWGGANLSKAEIETYNTAVTSLDPAKAEAAIRGLHHKMQSVEGFEGSTTQVGSRSGVESDTYSDRTQMMVDLGNPLYDKSSAFRQKTDAKISRSRQRHGGDLPA
ncbi:MAG TPA: hypothetical protein EYN51_10740 [Flavobacteriales bacterium]|nr:hypothetical protein [Flavobacteriales bacterium]